MLGAVVVVTAVLANDGPAGRTRGGRAGNLRSIVDRSVGMLVVRRLLGRPDPYAAAATPPAVLPGATTGRVPTRPTRIVVSGPRRPVAGSAAAPAASRLRLARDAGAMLVGVGAVVLLAMFVLPGGGVLGSTAPPELPAQVPFGSGNAPRGSAPAVLPNASRLDPLPPPSPTPLPLETPIGASTDSPTTDAPEATATKTPAATARPTPTRRAPPITPKPTPTPTPDPTPEPTPSPTEPPPPSPSPEPTPEPTPDPPSSPPEVSPGEP